MTSKAARRTMPSARSRIWAAALIGATLSTCVAAAATTITLAQSATPSDDNPAELQLLSGNWTVECQPVGAAQELLCEASLVIAVADTRQPLLVTYVTPVPRDDGTPLSFLRFQLPHGVDMQAGIRIEIDGGPGPSPVIRTSSPAGIFARTELTPALLASMTAGAVMTVAFSPLNGEELTITVTLRGFSAAFRKVQ